MSAPVHAVPNALVDVELVFVQVDEKMFESTKPLPSNPRLLRYLTDIKENFDIDWQSVEWKDLCKPLYSALGARLFVAFKCANDSDDGSVPRSIEDQAAIWRTYYRPEADEQHFITMTAKLENSEYNAIVIKRDKSTASLN